MQNYRQSYFQGDFSPKQEENMLYLRPEQIKLPKGAKGARKSHNAIIRLAASIRQYGLLEPLSVRPAGEDNRGALYELVDGKRRLQAALIAGLGKIPCILLPQDDRAYALSGIFESLQGKKLHFFEQAAGFRLLMSDFSLTQEEIADRLGISQSSVANKLRLLQFTREEQQDILEGGLTERHARAILRLKTPELRQIAIYRARSGRLNVADTENLVEQMLGAEPKSVPEDPQNGQKSGQNAANGGENAPKSRREGLGQAAHEELDTSFFEEDMPPLAHEREAVQGEVALGATRCEGEIRVVRHEQRELGAASPKKFALPDLTPLYNSIDRTLAIFRKTGADATCSHEEGPCGVRIIIEIPHNA